eukprot:1002906-Alexandrium_andersonii.AAC.1
MPSKQQQCVVVGAGQTLDNSWPLAAAELKAFLHPPRAGVSGQGASSSGSAGAAAASSEPRPRGIHAASEAYSRNAAMIAGDRGRVPAKVDYRIPCGA